MSKLNITDIRTGRGILGGRRAIITAPPGAQDGDLAALTDFLRGKGLEVHPGFDYNFVLHVGGFKSDAALRKLLVEEFPATVNGSGQKVAVPGDTPFIPMDRDRGEEKGAQQLHRFLKHYSSSLAGLSSFIAASCFLAQGINNVRQAEAIDANNSKPLLNLMSAGFFVAASALLAVLGYRNARQPSVSEIIENIEPQLNAEFVLPDQRSFGRSVRNAIAAMERNPWLVATVLNAAGGIIKVANHFVPGVMRDDDGKVLREDPADPNSAVRHYRENMELGGALFGFISLGLIAMAPRQQNKTVLGMEGYLRSPEGQAQVERATFQQGSRPPLIELNLNAAPEKKSGHNNMRIAGMLGAASNLLFGIKGANEVYTGIQYGKENGTDTHRYKMARSNMWLTPVPVFNLAADYFTSISNPSFAHSIDEIASEAAALLYRRQEKGELKRPMADEILVLSELLASQPAIVHDAKPIREAITEQMERRFGVSKTQQMEISNEYNYLDRVSPFTIRQPFANPRPQLAEEATRPVQGKYTARAAAAATAETLAGRA